MNWEIGIDIYTLLCIKEITNENLLEHRELYSVLCGDLSRKEIQKTGAVCIRMAGSVCSTVETNTTLQNNSTPVTFFFKEACMNN